MNQHQDKQESGTTEEASLCKPVDRPECEYIQMMADRRVEHYRQFYDVADNDWILQELEEWGDEVMMAASLAYDHGKMTKKEFQDTVSAARSAWIKVFEELKEYVRQEEYVRRLCGSC